MPRIAKPYYHLSYFVAIVNTGRAYLIWNDFSKHQKIIEHSDSQANMLITDLKASYKTYE